MVYKKYDLTLRQAQALVSIAYRKNLFSVVRLSDLIGDMGVGFATLADHLEELHNQRYILTPQDRRPHNLRFSDEITLTEGGEIRANKIMEMIGASYKDDNPTVIFEKVKANFQPKTAKGLQVDLWLRPTKTASFAKAFEKLFNNNRSEPVLTSIAMYTDLDTQLSLIHNVDKDMYQLLSMAKLNLEIRNGRLASIAIPTAIRGTTQFSELGKVLTDSWSWMGTVSSRSVGRYWQEAMSIGLLQLNGNLITSMKPTAVDTISWLASKTYFTFTNTIPVTPKCALVLFRESFNFPTREDLLNPQNASVDLPWLRSIWDDMADKRDYVATVEDGLKIVKDYANLLQDWNGRIVPKTIVRRINAIPDVKVRFESIMKQASEFKAAKILFAISARPGISMSELLTELNKGKTDKFTIDELWQIIDILAKNNLIHLANNRFVTSDSTTLYSFIHMPVFDSKMSGHAETNAVFKSMRPYFLQRIKELFVNEEEQQAIYHVFTGLMKDTFVDFEKVREEHGKTVSMKLLRLADSMEPFVRIDKDSLGFSLEKDTSGLNHILVDSLCYSMLTQNESLGMYNQVISDLIARDKPWATEIAAESKVIVEKLVQQNLKPWY
jgi:DNA-binding MarR family transcriptional regulator